MKTLRFNTFIIGLYLALLPFAGQASGSPTEQVKATVDNILNVLRDKEMDLQTRRSKIRESVKERFYFRAMSQRALSRNWKKASREQQDKFVELFSRLLENTYLGRIEAYTDERVEYLREKNNSPKRSVVYTQVVTKTADIPINYKLAKRNAQWLVYDVVIEEVSLISNYRSSYAEIIKKEGMDGLLQKMEQKVKSKESENNKDSSVSETS